MRGLAGRPCLEVAAARCPGGQWCQLKHASQATAAKHRGSHRASP